MTIKDDKELTAALADLLVPWDWEEVVLLKFDASHLDWVIERGLDRHDFCLHIDEPTISQHSSWPFPDVITRHHYLFKDPANATAFALTFLT